MIEFYHVLISDSKDALKEFQKNPQKFLKNYGRNWFFCKCKEEKHNKNLAKVIERNYFCVYQISDFSRCMITYQLYSESHYQNIVLFKCHGELLRISNQEMC